MAGTTLWAWDTTNNCWVKVKTDNQGRLYTVAVIDELNDIGDVNVPAPTDNYFVYWDAATSLWKCKAIDALAVAAVEAAGLTLAATKKIVIPLDGWLELGTYTGNCLVYGGQVAGMPHELVVQPASGNNQGSVNIMPSGTSEIANVALLNTNDPANCGIAELLIEGTTVRLYAFSFGTGNIPTKFVIHLDSEPSADGSKSFGDTAKRWSDIYAYHHQLTQALGTDHTWSGNCVPMTAGIALTIGQAVYVGGDSKMEKALATAAATMPAIALATGDIAENAVGSFLLQGFFRDDTWTWTPGGLLYVSRATAGELTQTLPAVAGEQVQVVGVAISADIIYFNPSFELVEIS